MFVRFGCFFLFSCILLGPTYSIAFTLFFSFKITNRYENIFFYTIAQRSGARNFVHLMGVDDFFFSKFLYVSIAAFINQCSHHNNRVLNARQIPNICARWTQTFSIYRVEIFFRFQIIISFHTLNLPFVFGFKLWYRFIYAWVAFLI